MVNYAVYKQVHKYIYVYIYIYAYTCIYYTYVYVYIHISKYILSDCSWFLQHIGGLLSPGAAVEASHESGMPYMKLCTTKSPKPSRGGDARCGF